MTVKLIREIVNSFRVTVLCFGGKVGVQLRNLLLCMFAERGGCWNV